MAVKKPGTIRIIAGHWRHRQLPVADSPGLRPTPDRVRETLFNWLHADLNGASCLDLFAGTGALGFEAASRGAASVVMVERDPGLARHLRTQAATLGAHNVQVICADALHWLRTDSGRFDLVFVDPPYGSVELSPLMDSLLENKKIGAMSKIYAETASDDRQPVFPAHWSVLREKRAGRVRYYLASPTADAA